VDINGRITLKCVLHKVWGYGLDTTGSGKSELFKHA
jgi:hypothetical protein